MNRILILTIAVVFAITAVKAQHYVGVKNAFGIMGVSTTPPLKDKKTISTAFNPGIVYRYEHQDYFAIQTELNYISKGYFYNDTTQNIYSYELPMLAQGGYRMGWFRPYLTGGAFIGYINKRQTDFEGKVEDYKTDDNDNRFEYGIIGGVGAGFSFSRFELQAEWRYQYAFSFLRKPHTDGVTLYMNPTQMMLSVTLLYRLSK